MLKIRIAKIIGIFAVFVIVIIIIFSFILNILNRQRSEYNVNAIFGKQTSIDKIVCCGLDLSIINFNLGKIEEYYKEIRKLGIGIECIGLYKNLYLYYESAPDSNEIMINGIKTDFSEIINFFKVSRKELNKIKYRNGLIYYSTDNSIEIYRIENSNVLKLVYRANTDYVMLNSEIVDKKYIVQLVTNKDKNDNKLIIEEIDNKEITIIQQKIKSFVIYGKDIYYNDMSGTLFRYSILTKIKYDLGVNTLLTDPKSQEKKITNLIYFKNNKAYFVYDFIDWEMPAHIIGYCNLTDGNISIIANVVGIFSSYQFI